MIQSIRAVLYGTLAGGRGAAKRKSRAAVESEEAVDLRGEVNNLSHGLFTADVWIQRGMLPNRAWPMASLLAGKLQVKVARTHG